MNLKQQIKLFLKTRGMTAIQLSRASGVPDATIADWLAGRSPRNLDQVKKVADVFGVSIDHLVYGEGLAKEDKITDIDALLGDGWIGGVFEVRLRRLKRGKGGKGDGGD